MSRSAMTLDMDGYLGEPSKIAIVPGLPDGSTSPRPRLFASPTDAPRHPDFSPGVNRNEKRDHGAYGASAPPSSSVVPFSEAGRGLTAR